MWADLYFLKLVRTGFDGPSGTICLYVPCFYVHYLYYTGRNNGMIKFNCKSDEFPYENLKLLSGGVTRELPGKCHSWGGVGGDRHFVCLTCRSYAVPHVSPSHYHMRRNTFGQWQQCPILSILWQHIFIAVWQRLVFTCGIQQIHALSYFLDSNIFKSKSLGECKPLLQNGFNFMLPPLEECGHLGVFVIKWTLETEWWELQRTWNSSLSRVTFHRNCPKRISDALGYLFRVLISLLIGRILDAIGKGASTVQCGVDWV